MTQRPPEKSRCPNCGAVAAQIVCGFCKTPRITKIIPHPAANDAKRREVSRFLAEQAAANPLDPEAA